VEWRFSLGQAAGVESAQYASVPKGDACDVSEGWGGFITVRRCFSVYVPRITIGAKTGPITHCTKIVSQSESNESCVRPVIVAVIRIWLCSPRTVSVALPRALLLSCRTVPAWTLSSLGPETS
jgi:hypothetical protein